MEKISVVVAHLDHPHGPKASTRPESSPPKRLAHISSAHPTASTMNQQHSQGDYYGAGPYGGSLNRSPSSARHGYASSTLQSSMAGNRRAQQQQTPLDGPATSVYDDRFFDVPPARFDRPPPAQGTLGGGSGGFGAFGVNQSSWAFNGGAATMSGPVHDGSRMRGVSRRPPLLAVRDGSRLSSRSCC